MTLLMNAVISKNKEMVKFLLTYDEIDVNKGSLEILYHNS